MEKQLPKNWTNTELSNLISHVIGGDWGKEIDFTDDAYVEALCIRGSEIKNWTRDKGSSATLRKIKKSSLESRKLELGDILLEISGGGPEQPVGRTVIIDYEALAFEPTIPKVCTNFLRLLRLDNKVNNTFINHYLQFFYNSGEITKYQGGSNNLRNLKFKEYVTIKIPLPPIPEQNRIVTKLDALFSQLETIKSSMANIPLLLKDFRQQVLTQAVTGKLTEEWRKEKKIKNWNFKKLEKVTLKVGSGSTPTGGQAAYLDEGIPLIRSMNVHFNGIKYDGLAYLNESQAKGLKNVEVFENDVLLNITGASIGRVCLAPKDLSGARVNQHVCIIRVNNELKPSFLNIYLSSPIIQNLINNENYGVTRQSFTKAQILELEIPIPLIDEQEIILNKVESLFAKADAIEKQYESLKAKIDNLPQALLHKAFKGELTEQLESDGDARELLKEIEALKAVSGKVKKGGKVVKDYEVKDEVLGMVAEPNFEYNKE